jgi:uncharacterized RmlC-like cupin family protein
VSDIRITRGDQLSSNTPQTEGMLRLAAINGELSDSTKICGGLMTAQPHTSSAVHHHGDQETVIYVVSGGGQVRWGQHGEFSENLRPGDFVFIPAGVPHQELNPTGERIVWVIVRSGAQPVVVNLPGFGAVVSTSAG